MEAARAPLLSARDALMTAGVPRLDDPDFVRHEYADESRLAARTAVVRELTRGRDVTEAAYAAVAEQKPGSVLHAGCGRAELSARIARELCAEVRAVDLSPRMVELARARGVDAQLADVRALPFADGSFDCAVANGLLYHVPDLRAAVRELARVLRPGGRLVATTFGERDLRELWRALGDVVDRRSSFTSESGEGVLRASFASVERRVVRSTVIFPDAAAVRRYVSVAITHVRASAADPPVRAPLRASIFQSAFVAEKAR